MIVLDASLVVAWLLGESTSDAVPIFHALPNEPSTVPCHWPLEIANALRSRVKSGHLSTDDFHIIMGDLDNLHVQIEPPMHPDEIGPLVQFSMDHDLTSYDAAYVQLAFRHQATLVTLDKQMRKVAMGLDLSVLPA